MAIDSGVNVDEGKRGRGRRNGRTWAGSRIIEGRKESVLRRGGGERGEGKSRKSERKLRKQTEEKNEEEIISGKGARPCDGKGDRQDRKREERGERRSKRKSEEENEEEMITEEGMRACYDDGGQRDT